MKRTFQVRHDNAKQSVEAIRQEIGRRWKAGQDCEVEVRDVRRSLPENALFHALLSEMSRKVEWAGAKRDVETWKRLIVSAWCRVNGEQVQVLPALDGHGVDIVPVRSSKLSRKECAELIEFTYATGAELGIQWDEQKGEWDEH